MTDLRIRAANDSTAFIRPAHQSRRGLLGAWGARLPARQRRRANERDSRRERKRRLDGLRSGACGEAAHPFRFRCARRSCERTALPMGLMARSSDDPAPRVVWVRDTNPKAASCHLSSQRYYQRVQFPACPGTFHLNKKPPCCGQFGTPRNRKRFRGRDKFAGTV